MHIAILPDADRGMPRWGVAPSHGLDGRIGIAAPAAVVQPQARQRHAESVSCTRERGFHAPAPRSAMYTRGSPSARASGAQNGSPGSRGERDTVKPPIIAPRVRHESASRSNSDADARPVDPPGTAVAAGSEITRIENDILGMDDAAVEAMGGFQACLHRIAEM